MNLENTNPITEHRISICMTCNENQLNQVPLCILCNKTISLLTSDEQETCPLNKW